ncbi:recombinase family protein [Synechococcus sp. MIT S9507]|uniref:recombinase family protein n=1 Tax=Synechococcus sp. MIT S9507 TaxID=3082544 RepID=UPI0039B5B662
MSGSPETTQAQSPSKGELARVIGYGRLSTADQTKGLTKSQQVERLKQAGADEVLFDVMTGTSTARPQYRKLLRLIESRSIDRVVATRWDRISRNSTETCRMVDVFDADGAPELLLLDDDHDLSTIGGRAQLRMLGVFAQMEAERIRERSAHGKAHRKAQGWIDVAPFGLRVVSGKIEIDSEPFLTELQARADWLESIGQAPESDRTAPALSKSELLLEAFAQAEIKGSMYSAWTCLGNKYGLWFERTGMHRLLLNPAFRGARVGKRHKNQAIWADVVEGAGGAALIDPERHLKFEAFIRGQMARRTTPDERQKHLLAGRAYCDHCGKKLTRGVITRSPHGRYYCRNKECSYLRPGERRNSVMEPVLLHALFCYIADNAEKIAEASERQASRADERAASSPEVQRLQAKRQRYLVLLAEGDPVKTVIDELDRNIADVLQAGPGDSGSHLQRMRERAIQDHYIAESLADPDGGSVVAPADEKVLASSIHRTYRDLAHLVKTDGEDAVSERIWDELRELVREVWLKNRELERVVLNLD